MIKLCYKKYEWELTNSSSKYFFDKTGLNLHVVLAEYITTNIKDASSGEQSLLSKLVALGSIYSIDVVNHALYSVIKDCNDSIPFEEIVDATHRVSWQQSDRDDDMSEPYTTVMLDLALDYNEYFNKNLPDIKKKVMGI